jgi:hypothetical protein
VLATYSSSQPFGAGFSWLWEVVKRLNGNFTVLTSGTRARWLSRNDRVILQGVTGNFSVIHEGYVYTAYGMHPDCCQVSGDWGSSGEGRLPEVEASYPPPSDA